MTVHLTVVLRCAMSIASKMPASKWYIKPMAD